MMCFGVVTCASWVCCCTGVIKATRFIVNKPNGYIVDINGLSGHNEVVGLWFYSDWTSLVKHPSIQSISC